MDLTRAEFTCFNLSARIALLNKDGAFLAERKVYRSHIVKLYRIYTFYVEVISELRRDMVIKADPIISLGMLALYTEETSMEWKDKIQMEAVDLALKERKIKVALVDDHSLFRQGLKLVLGNFDELDIIYEASNGEELIEKLVLDEPDVIFMDINMPVMDGLKTTQKLRELFPRIKIIAITMHSERKLLIEMLKSGACGYLYKNADAKEIYTAINQVIEVGFYFSEYLTEAMRASWSKKKSSTQLLTKNTDLNNWDIQVLRLICLQYNTKEIGELLLLGPEAVENHRSRLLKSLGVRNTAGLVIYAIENRLVDLNLS